jgi:hypothetical protein
MKTYSFDELDERGKLAAIGRYSDEYRAKADKRGGYTELGILLMWEDFNRLRFSEHGERIA